MPPTLAITRKLQQKLATVATMRDMPYMARNKVSVCAWHLAFSVKPLFLPKNTISAKKVQLQDAFTYTSMTYAGPTPLKRVKTR